MKDKIVLTRKGQKVLDEYQRLVDEKKEVTEELDKLSEELEDVFDFLGSDKFFKYIMIVAAFIFIFNVVRCYV